ncbi:MAG: acyl-CoA thioesterase II [Microscillaceae bacterium]|nr:acyl-CoA thioesterase II [Microscillaceae bacterium]
MKDIKELLKHLNLEKIEENLFRGQSASIGSSRVFGGQVLAQALSAAILTVPEERVIHSLHAYFVLAGDINYPIVYEVDLIRDGGSFTTRSIKAIQKGRPIFNMSASFHIREEGYSHQIDMPQVPPPEELANEEEIAKTYRDKWPESFKKFHTIDRPIEFRPVEPYDPLNPGKRSPYRQVWFKTKGKMPKDQTTHQRVLAYASDYQLLGTAIFPHGDVINFSNIQMASLDHAMWFHRAFRVDEWLLYDLDSPSTSSARGLCRGNIFTKDGKLVASVVQEGLIRPWNKSK